MMENVQELFAHSKPRQPGSCSIAEVARSVVASRTLSGEVPVTANTDTKSTNVASYGETASGIIVGSDLKVTGLTWNAVDPARARNFMKAARP